MYKKYLNFLKNLGFWKEYKTENDYNEIEKGTTEDNKNQVFRAISSKVRGYMAHHKTAILSIYKKAQLKSFNNLSA